MTLFITLTIVVAYLVAGYFFTRHLAASEPDNDDDAGILILCNIIWLPVALVSAVACVVDWVQRHGDGNYIKRFYGVK